MRRVLIPIDGTARSIKSVEFIKNEFKPGQAFIKLLMVREDVIGPLPDSMLDPAVGELKERMDETKALLDGYDVEASIIFGRAGDEVVKCAKKENMDMIVMTKSTKKGWVQAIGSVTSYVVKYAPCMVIIVPEVGYDAYDKDE